MIFNVAQDSKIQKQIVIEPTVAKKPKIEDI